MLLKLKDDKWILIVRSVLGCQLVAFQPLPQGSPSFISKKAMDLGGAKYLPLGNGPSGSVLRTQDLSQYKLSGKIPTVFWPVGVDFSIAEQVAILEQI